MRLKPPVASEVQKDWVPAHLAALIGAQHDRLDPVVEDFLGDAPQPRERLFVQPQQGLQSLVCRHICVHRA